MHSILVVFSIDLMRTLFLGVMGEFASFKGLKLSTTLMILAEVFGLALIRTESVLSVPSIKRASLDDRTTGQWLYIVVAVCTASYLLFSCRTTSILSNTPKASASRTWGSNRG